MKILSIIFLIWGIVSAMYRVPGIVRNEIVLNFVMAFVARVNNVFFAFFAVIAIKSVTTF